MKKSDIVEQVEKLIKKASESDNREDALKFSQAACNSANAAMSLKNLEEDPK